MLLEASDVVIDVLFRQHFSHIRLTGRISDQPGSAAEEGDWAVPGALHMRHDHHGDKMANMQAVSGWIKPNIKGDFLLFQKFTNLILIGALGNHAARLKIVKNRHAFSS